MRQTNREFAKCNELFLDAVEKARAVFEPLKPTKRQAAKFRRGEGLAFKHRRDKPAEAA